MNIYAKALKRKVRFQYKGLLSAEDLFDLTFEELDVLYKQLNEKLKTLSGDSLLAKENPEIEELRLQLALVKDVFEIKDADRKALEEKLAKSEKKQQILSVINEKKNAELHDKSIEELEDMLDD